MLNKIIPAVDTYDKKELIKLMSAESDCEIIKINYEIALHGLDIIEEIKYFDHKIFLDLKLYDIPSTMRRVCERLNYYGVDYVTVHGEAPVESIEAACNTFKGKVLVVCGLTSYKNNTSSLLFFAKKGIENGADGVICNGHQVADIKRFYPTTLAFCPGIRVSTFPGDDQVMRIHPEKAFRNGADYLICGRSFNEVKAYYEEEA